MINATIIEENIITNNRPMDHPTNATTVEKEKLDRANKSRHTWHEIVTPYFVNFAPFSIAILLPAAIGSLIKR